ncbi:arylamine N-acetyltransferase 1 [Mycena galericulata]|nr:arylamine N-acetyltransferase 1 [Mycena galericulata]
MLPLQYKTFWAGRFIEVGKKISCPYAEAKLSRTEAGAYLDRIKLSAELLDSPPSLSLLSTLFLSHLEQIPKDTSPLHVPEEQWNGPSMRIKLGSAFTNMPLGTSSFDRIVHENKGAFCFSINATFASFLRYFGFTVSELVARAFKSLENDPLTHPDGWKWGTLTHQLLVAGWPESPDRYLIDSGWGPWNLAKPLELPISPHRARPINIPGYTLYRRIAPVGTPHALPITSESPGYWSPLVHFHLVSVGVSDFMLYHHFSASHGHSLTKEGEGTRAKVYTIGGPDAQGSDVGHDVEWVEMETGPMKEYLTREFGFKF